jgi:hypothetical protein
VPTVSASRIIIARGLEDHLPDPLKLHLRTGQMHKVVLAAFHTMYQQTPAECTFTNLTRIATESALRNTELKLPPLALARWRSLTGDFLQLHRSPISNEHFRSVVNLLALPKRERRFHQVPVVWVQRHRRHLAPLVLPPRVCGEDAETQFDHAWCPRRHLGRGHRHPPSSNPQPPSPKTLPPRPTLRSRM